MQSLRAALVVTFLVDAGEIDVARAALKATARTRLPRGFVESAAPPPPPHCMHARQQLKRDRTEQMQDYYKNTRPKRLLYQNDYNATVRAKKRRKTGPRAPHTRWTDAEVAQLATYLVTPAAFNVRTKRMCWKGVEAAVPTKTGDQCRNKLHRQSSDGEHLRALVKAAHPTA